MKLDIISHRLNSIAELRSSPKSVGERIGTGSTW